jgi:hypothetical protein
MAITNTQLTSTSAQTVFTASGQQVVSVIYLCNTSGTDALVDVFAIPGNSVAAGNTNAIYSDLEITANDTYVMSTEKLILDNTDVLQVAANLGNVITVTVSSFAM